MISALKEKILGGGEISRDEALSISSVGMAECVDLFAAANAIRGRFRGEYVDLCAIVNAKSGGCPEDCSYCAQSSRSSASIDHFPLLEDEVILEKAREARAGGARRFCIVTSGRKVAGRDMERIASMVGKVRSLGLLPCATLGLLSEEELELLRDSGLERYHHNLETSERFFPEICTTHTYQDKVTTIGAVKSSGLSLCSGGIFGIGESWEDRVDMALALRRSGPDSVPINFLIPVKGTKLGSVNPLEPFEALKIISVYRFILPDKEIRVCGGRMQTLGDFHSFIFSAGADGLLTGNYLTTAGRNFGDDLRLIESHGLRYRR
ncbi:MAG: biotin synthase BioB [Candidatus Sulfobium sp.]|jgi:biotin synthase